MTTMRFLLRRCTGIKTLFVLFDACWASFPKLGTQPAPRPHVHNSG